ncbi:Store-operated calcium entry-associated regulatory factor [Stylophora pistillata]|uniref:Store-operated calcium entry-associated regulatory factor n=1 Tax=Stylophora pistillata TaxID=50429 RepID=A0A2B4RVN8_STYPI|nr:Store-operated calcium entry-associated regulatory factor [Stylophora pistillata]
MGSSKYSTTHKSTQRYYTTNRLISYITIGWGGNDKIRLTDVNVITLHQGKMTNSRRSHPVPQLKCVGGSAGCSAFTPSVVQCYNRGSDGYDVQWECKTDMDSQYKFGEVAVSCEGYDYRDDPYILKGSCGLEYTIDVVSSGGYYDHNNYHSGHRDNSYPNYYRHNYHSRHSGGWLSTIITWGVIAWIVYYIYQRLTQSQAQPPPPGGHNTHYSSGAGDAAGTAGGQGFWSAVAVLTMITMVIMVRGTIGDGLDTVLVGDLAGLGLTTVGPQDPPQVGPQAATTEEAPPLQALGPLQMKDYSLPHSKKNLWGRGREMLVSAAH